MAAQTGLQTALAQARLEEKLRVCVTMTMMETLYGISNPRESISLRVAWNFSDLERRNLVKSTGGSDNSDKSFPVVTEKGKGGFIVSDLRGKPRSKGRHMIPHDCRPGLPSKPKDSNTKNSDSKC